MLAGSCGGADEGLRIFAASSLREVLPQVEPSARFVFAGSDTLATQIREGAGADVFVSASPRAVQELVSAGVVTDPVVVASNRLVVIVPAHREPAVRVFTDLARPGVRLVLAGEGVPVGDYAREALASAGLADALDTVVSLEDSVSGITAKVALGEADAGVVYATDARIAEGDVVVLPVPASFQPSIEYVAAVVRGGDEGRATAFLDLLRGPTGQAALAQAGFVPVR
jgi:molybdate transport system substrate-binding protein